MAGIYIPGMEMPTECPCELVGIGYDLWCFAVNGIPARVEEYAECCQNGTRPSWCPLIPIPDHSDLIDFRFCEQNYEALRDDDGNLVYAVRIAELLKAPTIIPAEGKDGAE